MEALERYAWPGNVRELQNVVEQVTWMTDADEVTLADLPGHIRASSTGAVLPKPDRRRHLADDLYSALAEGHYTFWEHIHGLFLERDMTRHDLRQLMVRGLQVTRGNYRALLKLFGMPESDYKRLMNFLAAHDCVVDFRPFRVDPVLTTQAPRTPAHRSPLEQAEGA
jgi:transcriptional regulator of acetoin/glycerol metabolism